MPNEIGQEIEEEPNAQPSSDRRQGAFAKFFSDPKNIATALVFGASLAQPRDQSRDGLATLMQRATGAAAFRGALESGVQGQKLKREQTAFERAQAEREASQRDEQLDISRAGVETQRAQLGVDQSQFEQRMKFDESQAALNRTLEETLARSPRPVTQADYVEMSGRIAATLLETMEFDDSLTTQQKWQMAQDAALQAVIQARNVLASDVKVVTDPNTGKQYIDDGTGNNAFPTPTPTPAPAPAAAAPTQAPAAPRESPTSQVARIKEEQRKSTFAPTGSQKRELNRAQYGVMMEQEERRQTVEALTPMAKRFQRALEIGARPQVVEVRRLNELTDQELQQMGLRPQAIIGLRRLAEQLPPE